MSDSDGFDIFGDIKPCNFEPLPKKSVRDSINCEESAASADVDIEQPPMPQTPGPGPQQELDWCVFVLV